MKLTCGTENEEGRGACWKCYAPLTGAARKAVEQEIIASKAAPAAEVSRPAARTRPRALRMILIPLVVLAIGGAAAWWFLVHMPNTPQGVVLAYMKAAEKVDFKAMSGLVRKSEQEMLKSLPDLQKSWSPETAEQMKSLEAKAKQSKTKYKVESVSRQGDRAVVKVRPLSPAKPSAAVGNDLTFDWVAVKEDGKWKVDQMASFAELFKQMGSQLMGKFGVPHMPTAPGK